MSVIGEALRSVFQLLRGVDAGFLHRCAAAGAALPPLEGGHDVRGAEVQRTLSAAFRRGSCGAAQIGVAEGLVILQQGGAVLQTVGHLLHVDQAEVVGFSSLRYFSKVFKSIKGEIPSAYRKQDKVGGDTCL